MADEAPRLSVPERLARALAYRQGHHWITDLQGRPLAARMQANILREAAELYERLKGWEEEMTPSIAVVQIQPDDDSPGLWIGFKTSTDRAKIIALLTEEKDV
jgi:hypothetical protein